MTHTPGPWKVCPSRKSLITTDNDDLAIANAGMGASWEFDTDEANACLIAAAPELLEACEELYGLLIQTNVAYGDKGWTAIHKARAAIAKAKREELK